MISLIEARKWRSFVRMRKAVTYHPTNIISANTASCPVDNLKSETTSAKPFEAIPGPTGIYNLPYIGFLFHLKPFTKYTNGSVNLLFDDLIKQYGPIFKIRLKVPAVLISDPKDFAVMLRNEGKYPRRPNFDIFDAYYRRTRIPPNVASLQGSEWWKVRAPMQRMLMRPRQISQYLPMMNDVADDFIKMVTGGNIMENYTSEDAFMAYMAESAGTALYNKRLGFLDEVQSEEIRKLQQDVITVFDVLYQTEIGSSNAFRFFRSKDYRKFEAAMNYSTEINKKYVREAREKMNRKEKKDDVSDTDGPDMLTSLLNDVTVEEAAVIIEGLYLTSIDSSAAGMQVVLHTLAKHQDIQEKLREEIHNVLGKGDDDGGNTNVTQSHLDKMPYLKACIKEVYRSKPILPLWPTRILPTDVVLGGYTIPAGVQIYIYSLAACNDENLFENPREFLPERWLRQNLKQNNDGKGDKSGGGNDTDSNWALLPFGVGPRGCPGKRLFEQEIYLIVSKLLQRLKIGLADESLDTEFEYRLFRKPVKPLKFTFTPLDM